VSVVLPVYGDVEMTEACIEAAIPGILTVNRPLIVIVNDDSPDPGMMSMLHRPSAETVEACNVICNLAISCKGYQNRRCNRLSMLFYSLAILFPEER
jgi:hypothetical protein